MGRGPCLSFPHATGQQKNTGEKKGGGRWENHVLHQLCHHVQNPLWGWWNPCCKDDSHVVEVVDGILEIRFPTISPELCVLFVDFFSQVRVVTSNRVCIFGNTGIVKFQKKKHERFVVFIEKSLQTVSLYHVEVDKVEGISERTSRHFLEEMSGGMDRYVRIRVSHLILLMQHPCWQIYPHHVYFPKSPSKPLDTTKSTPTVSNGDMRIIGIHVFVRNGCINAPVIVFLWIVYLVWSVMLGSLTNLTNGVWLQGLCRYSRYQLLILIKEQSWGASRRQVSQIV